MLFVCQPEGEQSGGCYTSDLATGEKQREESRGKERLVVVEQSRSASKLGWPIPSNCAAVTAWCGSSSAALRLGYPWRRGRSLARECMRVHVLRHTAANRCTRCRASTKRWQLSAVGHHLANEGARSGTACPAMVWLAPACVCRRETLDGKLQAGRKRRQLDFARSRQRIAWVKAEPRLALWAQLARR
jgi:hypothetical protein